MTTFAGEQSRRLSSIYTHNSTRIWYVLGKRCLLEREREKRSTGFSAEKREREGLSPPPPPRHF